MVTTEMSNTMSPLRHASCLAAVGAVSLLVASGCATPGTDSVAADAPAIRLDFDEALSRCLTDGGVERPLEDVATRQAVDPVYAELLDSCVRSIEPDHADELLTGSMSPAARVDALNLGIENALECARDGGWDIQRSLPLLDSGVLDISPVLESMRSDASAFDLLVTIEECGGPPAPRVARSEFRRS